MDIAAIELDNAVRLPYTSKSIDFLIVKRLAILGRIPLEQEGIRVGIIGLASLAQ